MMPQTSPEEVMCFHVASRSVIELPSFKFQRVNDIQDPLCFPNEVNHDGFLDSNSIGNERGADRLIFKPSPYREFLVKMAYDCLQASNLSIDKAMRKMWNAIYKKALYHKESDYSCGKWCTMACL